ncbi:MAG: protein kinase [Polyangiaceae bacterium]
MPIPLQLRRFLQLPSERLWLGPYQLKEEIGRGAFAPVWLAHEFQGGRLVRPVAVKLFWFDPRSPVAGDRRGRVYKEARDLCRVQHPAIVAYHALVDGGLEARGVVGLVMELLDGKSLQAVIQEKRTLSARETMRIGAEVARALACAHRAGVIHRDVKPANIFERKTETGVEYKLIDFGVAAVEEPEEAVSEREGASADTSTADTDLPLDSGPNGGEPPASRVTRHSSRRGRADPALRDGQEATAASDIYFLGATLFECLTGKDPSGAKSRLRDSPSLAPKELVELIYRMLSDDAALRPSSAEQIAENLDRMKEGLSLSPAALPPESVGPFRGLRPFEREDRAVYFGRRNEIKAVIELLRTNGLVALAGPSGSGKSSLARAGVLPEVAEAERAIGQWPARWDVAVVTPGRAPRTAILTALEKIRPPIADADKLEPAALVSALSERAQTSSRGLLLLVDQLEQLTSPDTPRAEKEWTLDLLSTAGEQPQGGVRVLVTTPADLVDEELAQGRLGRIIGRSLHTVAPLVPVVWEEVLDQALSAYGYEIEDDSLREDIFSEIAKVMPSMPLVQLALTDLWERRDPATKKITRRGYMESGGLAGALDRHADSVADKLVRDPLIGKRLVRRVFWELTTPEGTRRVRTRSKLLQVYPAAARSLLATLEEQRLVVRKGDTLQLAYENLIAHWGTLSQWVGDARVNRKLMDNLERDARRYRDDPTAPLWSRRYIYLADHIIDQGLFSPSRTALRFLRVSRAADRWIRARRYGLPLLVLAMIAAMIANSIRQQAEADRLRADELAKAQRYGAIALNREKQANQSKDELLRDKETTIRALTDENAALRGSMRERDRLLDELQRAKTDAERREILNRIQTLKPVPNP